MSFAEVIVRINIIRSWMNMEGKVETNPNMCVCVNSCIFFMFLLLVPCLMYCTHHVYFCHSFPSSSSADGRENGRLANGL